MSTAIPNRFSIRHDSYFDYEEPVSNKVMLLRLQPRNDRGQHLRSFSLTIDPVANPVPCKDSFGNICHTISIFSESMKTHVRSTSLVNSAEGIDFTTKPIVSWDELRNQIKKANLWHYLAPSKLVYPGLALDNFIKKHDLKQESSPIETLRSLSSELYNRLNYEPGSTSVESPLEFFLVEGKGVCQDYTHTMLALARNWGIPCRYVSGYLYIASPSDSQSREVASHAWPEFWLPELGWYGLDPTNDSVVDHRFIRVAHGRDYSDVAPTRGVVFGGGKMSVSVKVIMKPSVPETQNDVALSSDQNFMQVASPPWQNSSVKFTPPDQGEAIQ